jgi:spoIIIJ-associated protein
MRNFSNQGSGSGKPAGSGGGRPPSGNGNRSGYRGPGGGGGFNREHRPGGDHRGGGYRGNNPRYDRGEGRGEHRSGGDRSHSGFNRSGSRPPSSFNRGERHERHERSDRGEGFTPRTGSSWVEVTGRSSAEAIEEAARRFNVGQQDLKTEVLDEGSKGFLGIGSKPAKVKISLKPSAVPPFAEGVLSRLLRGMSLPDKVKLQKDTDGNTILNIQGPSSGTLIGRHGHTLEALQYLVSKVVQRMTGDERSIIIVDVESYLERQKDKLKELAVNLAAKAKETGVEIPMRPMSSKDRRVVHMTLKDHEHVTTESRGEGLRRKVVIVPKVKATEVTPEATAAAEAAGAVSPESTEPPEDAQPIVANQPVAPSAVIPEPAMSNQPEPGNTIPKEPELDDNVGNRS